MLDRAGFPIGQLYFHFSALVAHARLLSANQARLFRTSTGALAAHRTGLWREHFCKWLWGHCFETKALTEKWDDANKFANAFNFMLGCVCLCSLYQTEHYVTDTFLNSCHETPINKALACV